MSDRLLPPRYRAASCNRYARRADSITNRQSSFGKSLNRPMPVAVGTPVAQRHRVAGAVTRTRLPQNAACGFPALRSSEIASQRGDSLQLRIPEIQLWSQQRGPLLDPMKGLPPDLAFPASAAQHSAPETLDGPMDPLQCPDVTGHAVVGIVTAKHLIELVGLILDRLVPHPPHLVLQMHQRTPQSCLLRTQPHSKVAFLIAGAVQGEAQKINRLRASPATLARVSLRIATKFDEFGLRLCQGQAKLPQSLAQYLWTRRASARYWKHSTKS